MYAVLKDIQDRSRKVLTEEEKRLCLSLLEDAAVIVDSYGKKASEDAKRLVSCNMVLRALGNGDTESPIGATQGSVSALGYTQSWTMTGGSVGELYLTKLDKRLLRSGNKVGFISPLSQIGDEP